MKLGMMLEVDETFTTIWLPRSSKVRIKVRWWPLSPIRTIFYLFCLQFRTSVSNFLLSCICICSQTVGVSSEWVFVADPFQFWVCHVFHGLFFALSSWYVTVHLKCQQFVSDLFVVCWLGGRKGIWPVKKLRGGILVWLSVWGEVQICIWPSWCHCQSLPLASVNPDWFYLPGNWLTWVVLDKIQRASREP